jgi:hypothetical protein
MSAFIFGIPFDSDLHKAWSFGQQGGNVSSLSLAQVPAASSSAEGSIASIQNNQSGNQGSVFMYVSTASTPKVII